MEIAEGNKLIAEFMGVDAKQGRWVRFVKRPASGVNYTMNDCEMKYHTSWSWLMPVVDKIRLLGHDVEILFYNTNEGAKHECNISACMGRHYKEFYTYGERDAKKVIWEACAEFSKWYSQQLQPANHSQG